MAARCDICSKGQQTGNLVSHSNIKTKRVWKPNIKRIKALINGTPKTIKVCTRCLRSGKVQRAI
ncbi:MAG: 50S ribosomal protein L28 [Firmicutes bacterium]|nr:50S ribosomal protein L28 [Bacillota bacterium]